MKTAQAMSDEKTMKAGVFTFDHDHGRPARELAHILGGKGAGLAEMTRSLGIPVPPGFTVGLDISRLYRKGGWPSELDDVLTDHIERLGNNLGRKLGDPTDPLLVSVRSGAPISMPGMLDTVLNLGLNDQTVYGLAQISNNEQFAWDSYRRFIEMFATIVRGIPAADLPKPEGESSAGNAREHVNRLREHIIRETGADIPQDPFIQLRESVEAVFKSWDSPRAVAYRERENIDPDMGTAVSIQSMVFGNRGANSGTGVVFTRDPNTGEPKMYGDYLANAQGEDVVAGKAHTMGIYTLRDHHPEVAEQLEEVLRRLEVHYRDMCDVEFTVEQGKLWVLQTRIGKRGASAAARIAVDLVDDPEISLSQSEAVQRVPTDVLERAKQETSAVNTAEHSTVPLATGLAASPGRATGQVVLSADDAVDAETDVILVRMETSPEDVMGMSASAGVLTTHGGLVSHAAVVARGWGIPAIVGAKELTIDEHGITTASGELIEAGQVITIDGGSGQIWLGAVEAECGDAALQAKEVTRLEQWAARLVV